MLEIDIREIPVFWINLDADVVRREAMLAFFDENKFENVTRVPGVVHSDHKTGVTLAHLDAFNASPKENFIIMEDDCVKSSWFSPVVTMPNNTDGFYLGVSQAGATPDLLLGLNLIRTVPVSNDICKIENMLAAHAIYYRSRRYARVCMRLTEDALRQDIAHDIFFAMNMRNCNVYCKRRPLFYQHSNTEATNIEW